MIPTDRGRFGFVHKMNLILLDCQEETTATTTTLIDNGNGRSKEDSKTKQGDRESVTTTTTSSACGSSSIFALQASDPRCKHIVKHLKKNVGDTLRIGVFPNGPLGEATIATITPTMLQLVVDSSSLRTPPPRPLVRVLMGIPYPKVIKALWAVLTAMGVDAILYARAALTDSDFLETTSLTPAVYQPLLREGLAQAQDTRPPVVTICPRYTSVMDLLTSSSSSSSNNSNDTTTTTCLLDPLTTDCTKIVLHIDNDESKSTCQTIRQCHQEARQASSSSLRSKGILLAIGPERGWTTQEVTAFGAAGFVQASLGDPVLRTDTAVVAAVALSRDVLLEEREQQQQWPGQFQSVSSSLLPEKRLRQGHAVEK